MDERHWWIAGKIQESFHIGGYDNPTLLEDFMTESTTMAVINQFLGARGPRRLFIYCEKPESGNLSTRELHVAQNLANLKDVNLEEVTVLYFVRKDVEKGVDAGHMEKDVFCGELKSSTMETLTAILSDIFIPMLKAQRDWGDCSEENKAQLMTNMDKYLVALSDSSASSIHSSKQMMLKQPEHLVSNEYKQHRIAALDQQIITEYEELVSDWITTIEPILSESAEDRMFDPNAGPLSELDRWRRRQRLFNSITEQLKGKECKAVIGVLITAKSKLLKKWKLIDAGITDAQNETKDKVKYLDSLKRHLEQFYDNATPWSIINHALPNLMTSIKQMDSISRFYARQGFLGFLLTKVTNQMVMVCKEYIRQLCLDHSDQSVNLWRVMDEEIETRNMAEGSDQPCKPVKSQVEARMNKSFKRSKDNKDVFANNDKGIYDRLRACLSLQSNYKEAVRTMRESLGAALNMSHFGSMSSLSASIIQSTSKRSMARLSHASQNPSITGPPSKKGSSDGGHSVSISDEDLIFDHLDALCARVRHVMDIINTLAQYKKIVKNIDGVPRPRREDIVAEEVHETQKQKTNPKKYDDRMPEDLPPQNHHHITPKPVMHGISEHGNLVPITEDEEMEEKEDEQKKVDQSTTEDEDDVSDEETVDDSVPDYADEVHDVLNMQHGLSQDEVDVLNMYYEDEDTDEGPSVVGVVRKHVQKMINIIVHQVSYKVLMDVESKDKERFEECYREFLDTVQGIEQFLGAYLHAVFLRKMTSLQALDLICRFGSIQHRQGIRNVIAEKFVDIFNAYEADLIQVQQLYEEHKESPPIPRNAPRIAGSISWSRQLLQRIEDPMRIFRDNRAITSMKDFSRIVKIYNRIATALVTFESLWFAQLKVHVENAKAGLRATLFIHHPVTKKIVVNADQRVLELIQEAKWLLRLNIQIPDAAHMILRQEGRFKNYKDHLELCLKEFGDVCGSIPECFLDLFSNHIEAVKMNLQPGLSTLAWNSMNIDAFLHQIHTAISKLKYLVDRVNDVIRVKVEGTIQQISEMIFFDYELAFSKSWPPEDFNKEVIGSVHGKRNKLYDYITTIEKGMAEAAGILTNKKGRQQFDFTPIHSLLSERRSATAMDTYRSGDGNNNLIENRKKTVEIVSQKSTPRDYTAIPTPVGPTGERSKGKAQEKDSKAPTRAGTQLSSYTSKEDHLIAELLNFYGNELYRAVLTATVRSLVTIAESCGCDDDIVRTIGVFSEHSSRASPSPCRSPSRVPSAKLDRRPLSVLSVLSDMSWTTDMTHEVTYLKFEVAIKFAIPNITMDPELDVVQHTITDTATAIMNVVRGLTWLGGDAIGESFHQTLVQDDSIKELLQQLSSVAVDLQHVIQEHLFHFSMYDFLWKDDLKGNFFEFIAAEPGLFILNREVDRLLRVERQVMEIPSVLPAGPVALITDPVKNALHGFAIEWKTQYASVLHEEAKKKLDAATLYRMNVRNRLELHVANLDQLNSTLHLLEELHDMENKIDGIYLPIENMYMKLRDFELRLPRSEVEEVDSLRDKWQELLELGDNVRMSLMREKRSAFEQELDKQVKTFVVEVIQFRNAFDAQGPAVPGVTPQEAVLRLHTFQQKYQLYDSKRRTLDSVSKLFGIPCKPFPELDRTGEELELLGMLYGLYQKYIRFDQQFRDTLWADVDLEESSKEVEGFWDECLALPSKLKDWEAYNGMKAAIQQYLDVFPLLQRLASKEIRNRHWLQVMQVTGSSFQLEANVFKLCHLLDIGLIKHRVEIEEICHCASKELELEVKLRVTEEEWTEQVLSFEPYKRRGPIFLEKVATEHLLEQLEDAEALLAGMLTSRYIGPMREEAAGWAEKLKEVGEVLELWLEVQDLWQYLEAVFSYSAASKELPQEAKRFSRIDKGWTKMMKRAYDTRNVLQNCYGGEVPKAVVLRHIFEELELCFKSLTTYLDSKRRSFPRFYFVSDPILLAMLSRPNDLDSIRPYLKTIFTAVSDVSLEVLDDGLSAAHVQSSTSGRRTSERIIAGDRSRTNSVGSGVQVSSATPAKVDKRLTQIHKDRGSKSKLKPNIPIHLQQHISILPSEEVDEVQVTYQAVAVKSCDGESLTLKEKIPLTNGVEMWLQQLKHMISETLSEMVGQVMADVNNGVGVDEVVLKYPTQICRFGLLFYWTRECEAACAEIKYDRKALPNLSKKFSAAMAKLPQVLAKGSFKGVDEPMLPVHKIRLEHLITHSLYLRDSLEMMATRKIREPTDFEWRRNFRCYLQDLEGTGQLQPVLTMVDHSYKYGSEFYGAYPIVALTGLTERCFLIMATALRQHRGVQVIGGTGAGKTETIKGFAHLLGHHLTTWQCSQNSDPSALGKVLVGLSSDGCWGLFDNVQNSHSESMSVLMDHAQAIFTALRGKLDYCYLGEGHEVAVNPNVSMYMTVNPTTAPGNFKLPSEIKSLFRSVSLARPDYGVVLKLKCSALGFKAPNILGTRLKVVQELAKDQMPQEHQNDLSITSLMAVLSRAVQRRKLIRDEKADKSESSFNKKDEQSRSNSQTSVSNPNMPSLSSASMADVGQEDEYAPPKVDKRYRPRARRPGIRGVDRPVRKTGTSTPLTPAARMEHALVGQSLLEIMGARLNAENYNILRLIVKDAFFGLPEPAYPQRAVSAKSRYQDVEQAIRQRAKEKSLVPHQPWIDKCMQLYNVAQVNQGIIVAGPPGAGKSSIIQTLVDALSISQRSMSRHSMASQTAASQSQAETNHRLQKINPLVVDESELMFGHLQNKDWVDGIFTSAWRKANRNQCTTWLCLDGPLHAGWSDHFSSVLDHAKTLYLANGDRLPLSDNMKLLFETDSLVASTPATVSRAGIVFVDKDIVGWKPIAQAWLDSRTTQENHVLQRAFDNTVNKVAQYVLNEAKPRLKLCEIGMFQTCLNLLSAMLADNKQIGGELHIERLYLFCLIWAYGGLLEDNDRKAFSNHLKNLSSALPDDDRDICVFDYYVDEAGEWDPWFSRVPEAIYADNQDILGEVFVDTVDTIRTRILMEFAVASSPNVLLVGPPGSGKTIMVNDFIDSQDSQKRISKHLVYSGASTARQLQQFIEANIYHRQGFVFGAKENKQLQIFIDDLNLPIPDSHNVQKCNELLRQLLDDKVLCTLQKPFEWRSIEGLVILSSMSMNETPSVTNRVLNQRLLRHFAVLRLPGPKGEALKTIVNGILEGNMTTNDQTGFDIDLHNALTKASCQLLSEVQAVLRMSPMSGRRHYLFTLKDITTCFQCLKRLADESRADEHLVISLWRHEMQRIMRDRLCRAADINWLDAKLEKVVEEIFPNLEKPPSEHFVTFPIDTRLYQRPVTSHGNKQVKVLLQPIENLQDVLACLKTHVSRYNEEFGNVPLDIMLSDHVIGHIIKMHRVLSFHHGGNILLIGAIGLHLSTLCRLALHVADIPIHPVDTSKQNTFFDGLRSALRLSGSEGKVLSVMFSGRDLHDDMYLDAINSLLISGEYPHLFTNDELEGLLQAVTPALRREHPTMISDPMKFFVSRVRSNLHIILCLPPHHKLIRNGASQYPGLLQGCQVNWICDWPQDALLGESLYYMQDRELDFGTDDLLDVVGKCLANIHSSILVDTRQMPWAGETMDEISVTQVKLQEKKKDAVKVVTTPLKLPNLPYSKSIILENIRLLHQDPQVKGKNQVFVGPMTYRRFMDNFNHLYRLKSKERTEKVDRLQKVLSALSLSRKDAKVMRQAIKNISKKFEDAKVNTATLLKQLTAKATVLEKLKAKVGQSTSLSAFLQLNEVSDEEEDEDDLLQADDYDEYDREFDERREAELKSRQLKAKEELVVTLKRVEDCRNSLENARQQVYKWRTSVDRQCIERLKAFSQPPALVGHVMEMVMTLIGKRIPGMQRPVDRDTQSLKEDTSSRVSASSSSTKLQQKKQVPKKEVSERVDRNQWKGMTNAMNDSTKFMDMLHNVQWEDGLSPDVLNAVESYLARGRGGALGVTGEGSLLENAPDNKAFAPSRRSPSPEFTRGITLANARFASEDAATLVQYTIAIVEYTRLCGPLRSALEKQHNLEREIEESERLTKEKEAEPEKEPEDAVHSPEPEDDLTEDDLPRIQDEVNELQKQFDESVIEKHSLEMELISMNERLRATTEMIESLKGQEGDWKQHVKDNDSNETLLANCIAAAAFLTYCGAFDTDTRKRLGEFFMTACEHHGLKLGKKQLFRNMDLIQFLCSPIQIKQLEILSLPKTRLMLENACYIMAEEGSSAWPLVCDPTSRIATWIKLYHKDKNMAVVKYNELRSQLETSLSDGIPLVVTDVDVATLAFDKRFTVVLRSRMKFIDGTQPFKIMVGDHEVECQPSFRMYLHTTDEPHEIPAELSAHMAVILFQGSRKCIVEELLDRFMEKEKPRLEEEKTALNHEWLENMVMLEKIEEQMLICLASDTRLMNDLVTTKKLADLKKQWDETKDNQSRVDTGVAAIMRAREGFRAIAQRGAVLFDTSQYMREVNPLYKMAYTQFLSLFDAAIAHSDRASVKAVVERLTLSSYSTTMRSLLEKDRPIQSLLLAIEVEDSQGRIGPGEREYLLSPQYGQEVMKACGQTPDSRFTQAKKPFDWMTDDQFQNLQILACYFDWFQEMFERMPRDGRETQWRNLCESESPETTPLPDKMDDVYSPMQRLCVIRAVRSDRIMQASTLFVTAVFGKKFICDAGYDCNLILKQSTPQTPILMLNTQEPQFATKLFMDFAVKKQGVEANVIHLYSGSHVKERQTKKAIQKAMEEGSWILLQNAHNAPNLLGTLESFLAEEEEVDPNFRCWVSVQMDVPVPTRVLQSMLRIVIDAPKTMKMSLYRFFNMDADTLKMSERPEWPAFLHNICFLHGAIRLRGRFGTAGWNEPQAFDHLGFPDLMEALQVSVGEFQENLTTTAPDGSRLPRPTSWSSIRYLLTEVLYGSRVTDSCDQASLGAMVDYWISPTAVKKEFELSKLKYKHPAIFFSSYCKQSSICQAIENYPSYMLEVPEACNLHPYGETILGDDQYVFTRLNKVFDAMPSSDTLTHKLFERPPTPFSGPPQANVSSSGNMPQACQMGVVASASYSAMRSKKDVELWEICYNLQSTNRVPKPSSPEYVAEKMKKIGGDTIFNLFIKKEMEILWKLLTEIKQSISAIKAAVEVPDIYGDHLSPTLLVTADDLYYNRIPRPWLKLAGPTAPPSTYSLNQWLLDLENKRSHFEKILELGKEKMPAYCLGAFTYPRTLLAIQKQESYRRMNVIDKSETRADRLVGNIDNLVIQTEITSRDKEHLRDPPKEGMFVYGINIWGCSWEKTSGELQDVAPRQSYTALPVIHVTYWPQGEKPNLQDPTRASETFQCPVFQSKTGPRDPIIEIDLRHEGYPASRWALRGLTATINPY